jgi:hypothetical protein
MGEGARLVFDTAALLFAKDLGPPQIGELSFEKPSI